MKTICPHCNQEYDVTEDYLNQTVTCTACNKDFVVEKALSPLEKAEMFAKEQQKKKRRTKLIKWGVLSFSVLVAASFFPLGYSKYISYSDQQQLQKYQQKKAAAYHMAKTKMIKIILEAKNNQLGTNATRQRREKNLKDFIAKYNTVAPDLELPFIDNETLGQFCWQMFFSGITYGYEFMMQTDWWRKDIENELGPIEDLK